MEDYCPSGSADLILTCPLTQGFTVWTDRGDLRGYKPWMYFHCLKHSCKKNSYAVLGFSSRLSENVLSWPSAVWILTVRKTLQQWAKLLARSACGRSSMTECHSSSQHCDVQSASTSRPWPLWKAMHNWGNVRIKQARRMIAATLQNTEREKIQFLHPQ